MICSERHDRIRDRELRCPHRLGTVILTDPKGRDRQRCKQSRKFMKEAPEGSLIGCIVAEGFETIDHQQRRPKFSKLFLQLPENTRKALVVEGLTKIVVKDLRSDSRGV